MKIARLSVPLLFAVLLTAWLFGPSFARPDSAPTPANSPGPYEVGFAAIEKFDHTRTFRSPRDYFGDPVDEPSARPLQISLWYPAVWPEDAVPLVYSEYTFPYPQNPEFYNMLSRLQDRESARLQAHLGGDERLVVDLMATPTQAVRDAPWANGSFPLLIHCGDIARSGADNAGLWEHLASQGYVVATFPSLGTAAINPEPNLRDLETLARDIENAYAIASDLPNIDRNNVAVAGTGMGAQAALLVASRNRIISSVVLLFGGASDTDKPLVCDHPSYDRTLMTAPILAIGPGYRYLDSCRFTERLISECTDLPPTGLSHSDLLIAQFTDTSQTSRERLAARYHEIGSHIRYFLDWQFNADTDAQAHLTSADATIPWTPSHFAPDQRPPTPYELLQIIETRGVPATVVALDDLGLPSAETPIFPEMYFNNLGYQRMQRGDFDAARIMFGWATRAYPNSANAWDSFAELSLMLGDSTAALEASRHALKLLPNDSTTSENLKAILGRALPARIEALEAAGTVEPQR